MLILALILLNCFPDDDDDLDEEHLPGFSLGPPPPDKGKGRAHVPEQLAPPSNNAGRSSPVLSGRIGGPANGAPPTRQTVGGVQVETRCVLVTAFHAVYPWSHLCIDMPALKHLMSRSPRPLYVDLGMSIIQRID